MNTGLKTFLVLTVGAAASELFAVESERDLVQANERGRWTFSAGPAWRSRVKMETRGTVYAPSMKPPLNVEGKDMSDPENWTRQNIAKRDNPNYPESDAQYPYLWGVYSERVEIYDVSGDDYDVSRSDDDSPLGINLQSSYELYRGKNCSAGLSFRCAGYWNMESSSSGYYNAGGTKTEGYRDWWLFDTIYTGSFANDVDPEIGDRPKFIGGTEMTDSYVDKGSHTVTTRLRSDLYQIGFGPKVSWSPFADWCRALSWIDVYGGVELLGNVAYSKLTADGSSTSSTEFLFGVGGFGGILGRISERISVYGQIGYEWIDDADLSVGDFRSEIDYSSMVISAGVQFSF